MIVAAGPPLTAIVLVLGLLGWLDVQLNIFLNVMTPSETNGVVDYTVLFDRFPDFELHDRDVGKFTFEVDMFRIMV